MPAPCAANFERCSKSGLTLIEVLVAVAILGIVAVAAIPDFSAMDDQRLERAAIEVADAVRFARSEALRTATPHGVHGEVALQRVRVFRLVDSGGTPTPDYTVRNPVDKKVYHLQMDAPALGVAVDAVDFSYAGVGPQEYLGFDTTGYPVLDVAGVQRRLTGGTIILSRGVHQRTVRVAAVTGRVTVE
jgi:prepilin-type N-terminal cleavage/methylation domain-containing protein